MIITIIIITFKVYLCRSSSEVAGCSLEKDGLDNAQINNQIIKTQVEDGVCTTEVLAVKDNEIQKEILTTDPEKENLSQVNCNENASTTEKEDEVRVCYLPCVYLK